MNLAAINILERLVRVARLHKRRTLEVPIGTLSVALQIARSAQPEAPQRFPRKHRPYDGRHRRFCTECQDRVGPFGTEAKGTP